MVKRNNILLVQLGDIGDVVLSTPTIRAVKEAYPNARVSIVVRKPFGSLLAADPDLHEVLEAATTRGIFVQTLLNQFGFAYKLWRSHYDLVIDLRTSNRGALLALFTRARERIGRLAGKSVLRKIAFTKLLADPPYAPLPVHPGAEQSLRIVRAIGIEARDSLPHLNVARKDADCVAALLAARGLTGCHRWISVNPCSRWKYKEWEHEKWGEIIDLLWQDYQLKTILVGSPDEADAIDKIISGRNDHAFNLAGKTTLGELSALIALSTLHLGVDSAAPHIAAAVGRPTLTIFGPSNWKSWTIADKLHRIVTADMPCIPCNNKGCDDTGMSRCLNELSMDRVYANVNSILLILDFNRTASS